jgi:hypothetical protein
LSFLYSLYDKGLVGSIPSPFFDTPATLFIWDYNFKFLNF